MKIYILSAIAILSMSACNQKEIDKLSLQNDSLVTVVNQRNEVLTEIVSAFNEVERNLDSVAVRQHLITVNTQQPGELQQNQKARINSEIEAINKLMDANRQSLEKMTARLKKSNYKNVQLEKTIETITKQLTQKDIELTALNERLSGLNAQVAVLETSVVAITEESNQKSQQLAETTSALHTAFYVVGKSKDLQNANLIDRKGGLLGIGKSSKLNSNIDNSKFTKIDYTQTTSIPVNNYIKIITVHPTYSYSLEKDIKHKDLVKNIVITDPEKFWSASKYLVVVED